MKNYHFLDLVAVVLLLVGGLNWGLVGLFNFNPISSIFGIGLSRFIFALIGVAAAYRIVMWSRAKKGA